MCAECGNPLVPCAAFCYLQRRYDDLQRARRSKPTSSRSLAGTGESSGHQRLGPDRFYFLPLSHLYALRRFEITPHAPLVQTRIYGAMGAKGGQQCQECQEYDEIQTVALERENVI